MNSGGTQKAQRKKRKKHKPIKFFFFALSVKVLRFLCSQSPNLITLPSRSGYSYKPQML